MTDISKEKYLNDKGYAYGLHIRNNREFDEPERPFLERFEIVERNFK